MVYPSNQSDPTESEARSLGFGKALDVDKAGFLSGLQSIHALIDAHGGNMVGAGEDVAKAAGYFKSVADQLSDPMFCTLPAGIDVQQAYNLMSQAIQQSVSDPGPQVIDLYCEAYGRMLSAQSHVADLNDAETKELLQQTIDRGNASLAETEGILEKNGLLREAERRDDTAPSKTGEAPEGEEETPSYSESTDELKQLKRDDEDELDEPEREGQEKPEEPQDSHSEEDETESVVEPDQTELDDSLPPTEPADSQPASEPYDSQPASQDVPPPTDAGAGAMGPF